MTTAAATFDPADPVFLADPHATFDALRPHGGVVRDPLGWSTISYDACSRAFLDAALVPGIDALLIERGYGPLWGVPDQTLTDSEGEAHHRLRRAVAPWFTPRRIDALRDRTRLLVGELLDSHDPSIPLPLMAQLADVVPARLFCWMVGAGEADAAILAPWSKALLLVFTATDSMVTPVREAKEQLARYTGELLAHKRKHPGDDLTTALATAAANGQITEQDAYYLLEELLSASVDNTANTAGLAVHTLAEHPEQWAAVHADPQLLEPAVEECGRFQPAIRHTIKYAVADTVVETTPVERGSYVTVRIAAAHRDPAVYDEPHVFDISRRPAKGQLAFGAGRHYCLGAALGKMEVQEIVGGLTTRWAGAEIADGAQLSIAASGHVFELPLLLGAR
jgi:cytochrome P450